MSRRSVILVLLAAVLCVGGPLLLAGASSAAGSVRSRGARGWLVARRYLEARGVRISLLDRPLSEAPRADVLLLVFPWQVLELESVRPPVERHLARGGTLVVAYSGRSDGMSFQESHLLEDLGLPTRSTRGEPPLRPWKWRAFRSEEWRLSWGGAAAPPVVIGALDQVVEPPEGAAPLLRNAKGEAVAFTFERGKGRVVVLPADALSNGRLAAEGNADLLESLRPLGREWLVDEAHHGFTAGSSAAGRRFARIFDLYLVHLAFLYLVTVLALVRRFGPPWTDPPTIAGSTAAFFLGLGRLHDRLGHHAEARRLLRARVQELYPRLRVAEGPRLGTSEADRLLELARDIARAQSGRSE